MPGFTGSGGKVKRPCEDTLEDALEDDSQRPVILGQIIPFEREIISLMGDKKEQLFHN